MIARRGTRTVSKISKFDSIRVWLDFLLRLVRKLKVSVGNAIEMNFIYQNSCLPIRCKYRKNSSSSSNPSPS